MIIIADSNIFISALITPKGIVASVLAEKSQIQFFAPSYVIDEVKAHVEKIALLAEKNKKVIWSDFKNLLKGIEIVNVSDIPDQHILQAENIVKDIDIKDAIFVALHLYKKHKIWTGDNTLVHALKEKGYNFCVTTAELKRKLYKK